MGLGAEAMTWPGCAEVARSVAFKRHVVSEIALVTALRGDLDRGEAETIVLSVEMHADLVLLDEKEARRTAERLGLKVMGVLGVLLHAKTSGLISEVRPHLDSLKEQAGFYLGSTVYDAVLQQAKET